MAVLCYPVESALEDRELTEFQCPVCGGTVRCSDYVKQHYFKRVGVGICENGDEFFVRFRFFRANGKIFLDARVIYDMDEEHREFYMSKKARRKERAVKTAVTVG